MTEHPTAEQRDHLKAERQRLLDEHGKAIALAAAIRDRIAEIDRVLSLERIAAAAEPAAGATLDGREWREMPELHA